jgi:hypothetical protein
VRSLAWGIGVLAALCAALVAAAHASTTVHSPLRPGGTWTAIWIGGVAGAFLFYAVGLTFASRAQPAAVLALAAAIQLSPLAGPLLLSTDVFSYWDYGRIQVVHEGNPYADPPSRFRDDPAYRRVGTYWQDKRSVYGPVFTLASAGEAKLVGDSERAAAWLYRLLASLAVVATAAFAALAARRPSFAAAFVGWNPLLALHFGGGGHNDALMAALLLGALAAAAASRRESEGAGWALASAVKIVPLALLPLRLLERRERFGWRGFIGTSAVVGAVASVAYGYHWLSIFGAAVSQLHETSSLGLTHWGTKIGVPQDVGRNFLVYCLVLGYGWLAWQAWQGRARLALAACLLVVTTPWLQPWYVIWALPLAAIEEDRLARAATVALSAYVLRDAIPI